MEKVYQGKGLAQKAMEELIAQTHKQGLERIRLTVNKTNAKAIAFYEKQGFEKIADSLVAIGQGYVMDDYIYEFRLKKNSK